MTLKPKLAFHKDRIFWGQTTDGTAEITNESDVPLEYVNYVNEDGLPTLVISNKSTGDMTEHARRNLPGATPYINTIRKGETWKSKFKLCYEFQFPSVGKFEIQARFEWESDSAESEPVDIEVLPTLPVAMHVETTGGGPVGDIFCAWVNKETNGSGLWLSLISAMAEAHFIDAWRLCEIAPDKQPVLSVPNNHSPTSQYVAWIVEDSLRYAVYTYGRISTGEINLPYDNYEVVPPLLEDPFLQPYEKQNAEALLMRQAEGHWELRLVNLGEDRLYDQIVTLQGSTPQKSYTIYRSDGKRRTIFWEQSWYPDMTPAVVLSTSKWEKGILLSVPQIYCDWKGTLVAADQTLTSDVNVIGAVLLRNEVDGKNSYEIRKWRLNGDDEFAEYDPNPIIWESDNEIEEAVLRVRHDEYVFLMFRFAGESIWRKDVGNNENVPMPGPLREIRGPMSVFFVGQTVPAVLYTDPTCGLRIAFEGAAPKRFSPTGR